jgi:hypothetical protein
LVGITFETCCANHQEIRIVRHPDAMMSIEKPRGHGNDSAIRALGEQGCMPVLGQHQEYCMTQTLPAFRSPPL